eukprot:7337295-Prymnesium_polylepis.2
MDVALPQRLVDLRHGRRYRVVAEHVLREQADDGAAEHGRRAGLDAVLGRHDRRAHAEGDDLHEEGLVDAGHAPSGDEAEEEEHGRERAAVRGVGWDDDKEE